MFVCCVLRGAQIVINNALSIVPIMAFSLIGTLLALFGGAYLSQRFIAQQISSDALLVASPVASIAVSREYDLLKREIADYTSTKATMQAFKSFLVQQSDPAYVLESEISDLQVNVSFADAGFVQLQADVELLISEYSVVLEQIGAAADLILVQNSIYDVVRQRIQCLDYDVKILDTSTPCNISPYSPWIPYWPYP